MCRGSELLEQQQEIAVFGDHHGSGLSGSQKDLAVFRVTQAELSDRHRLDVELRGEPPRQMWRKLRLYPNDQAATTG